MPSSRLFLGILPWYSVLVVSGICAAIFWCMHEEKRLGLYKDATIDLALCVVPCGILGARLYYVAFAWDAFKNDLLSILYVWHGGLAIYGGIIGGVIAALVFAKCKKLRFLTISDMIMPGLALAQSIGRWGNYFNMEAFGVEVTDPALQFFPLAVRIPSGGGYAWHTATFFYESVWNLGVFLALCLTRKRMRRRGDVTLWYALLYGAGRLVIEGLRTDSLMAGRGTVRVSQLLSVALCLVALCVFVWRMLRGATKTRRIAGATILAVAMLAVLLLPAAEEAFLGYRAAWSALIAISLSALVIGIAGTCKPARWLFAILPALAMGANVAFQLFAASRNYSGVEASTLLCCLFSLTAIIAGTWAYTASNSASLTSEHTA